MNLLDAVNLQDIKSYDSDIIDNLFTIIKSNDNFAEIDGEVHNICHEGMFLRTREQFNSTERKSLIYGLSRMPSDAFAKKCIAVRIQEVFDRCLESRRNCIAQLLQSGNIITTKEFDGSIEPKLFEKTIDIVNVSSIEDILFINSRYAIMSKNTFDKCNGLGVLTDSNTTIFTSEYYKDNIITLLSTLNIGQLMVGVTPEECDKLCGSLDDEYMKIEMSKDNSFSITCRSLEHPDNLEMIVSTLFMPVFYKELYDKISIVNIKD